MSNPVTPKMGIGGMTLTPYAKNGREEQKMEKKKMEGGIHLMLFIERRL